MQKTLSTIYKSLNESFTEVYVVPSISPREKKTNYLYSLYKEFRGEPSIQIHSISVFGHWKFVVAQLFKKDIILHYHWLEFQSLKALMGMPYKLVCISLFKLFGGKLVWTMHNKTPHDKKYLPLHYKLALWMARKANMICVHCDREKKELIPFLVQNESKFVVINHPLFDVQTIPLEHALKKIETKYSIAVSSNETIFLVFGQISHYKGIDHIITSFKKITSPATLIIAGPIKKGNAHLFRKIQSEVKTDNRIHLIAKYIPEEDVEFLHSIADFCVFNYSEIMTSGAVMMAKSFKRSIIAPNKGCIANEDNQLAHIFDSQNQLEELMFQLSKK